METSEDALVRGCQTCIQLSMFERFVQNCFPFLVISSCIALPWGETCLTKRKGLKTSMDVSRLWPHLGPKPPKLHFFRAFCMHCAACPKPLKKLKQSHVFHTLSNTRCCAETFRLNFAASPVLLCLLNPCLVLFFWRHA